MKDDKKKSKSRGIGLIITAVVLILLMVVLLVKFENRRRPSNPFANFGSGGLTSCVSYSNDAIHKKLIGEKLEGNRIFNSSSITEEYSIAAEEITDLDIDLIAEDLFVEEGSGSEIKITIYSKKDGVLPEVHTSSGTLYIAHTQTSFRRGAEKVVIALPAKNYGNVDLVTISGEIFIKLKENAETVSLKSVSGDVAGKMGTIKRLVTATTSGDVYVEFDEADRVEHRSVSGEVEFKGKMGEVDVNTTSGDVKLYLDKELDSSSSITTISGEAAVIAPYGKLFNIDYSTISGDVYVNHTDFTMNGSKKSGQITCQNGSECARLRIHTTSGDISFAGTRNRS